MNKMNLEIRADGSARITGYVNATEKKSRPVITPHGKVVEEIEPRAFESAIARAGNITLTVDHDNSHVYAETSNGTLQLTEDDIGLHADVTITDPELIKLAQDGKIRGWSFGMYNVVDEIEPRANDLPLRKISALDLDHVTFVVKKIPCYSATSLELRAENDVVCEERATDTDVQMAAPAPQPFDYSPFINRLNALKK